MRGAGGYVKSARPRDTSGGGTSGAAAKIFAFRFWDSAKKFCKKLRKGVDTVSDIRTMRRLLRETEAGLHLANSVR